MKTFKQHFRLINEGGSLTGTGSIHKSEIEPTLKKLEDQLGIDLLNNTLGSVGKKEFSGDIDIAVDIPPEDTKEFVNKLKSTPGVTEVSKTSVIMCKVEIEDFDPNKSAPGRTGYVQVDFMPGDKSWMKTYYHSPFETDSKYKGAYRNILIGSIATLYNIKRSEEETDDGRPLRTERFMLSPAKGLVKIVREPAPKRSGIGYLKKNINTVIDGPWTTADEIAQQLNLGVGDNLDSYETIVSAMKENYDQSLVDNILKKFNNDPFIINHGIPEEENESGNRVGIKHIYSLNKPDQYSMDFNTLKAFRDELTKANGILSPGNTTLSEKADGLAMKFGMLEGKFFVQSSYSGPVTDPKEFESKIKYAPVAKAFKGEFNKLKRLVKPLIKHKDNVVIQAEWLHSPLATEREDRPGYVYFVATDYKKEKLGLWSTFIVIDAPADIKGKLLQINNDDIKFLPTNVDQFPEIDLSAELQDINTSIEEIEASYDTAYLNPKDSGLNPRLKEVRLKKKEALDAANANLLPIQKGIYYKIYDTIKDVVGSIGDVEGVVLKLGQLTFKVNNPDWMKRKFNISDNEVVARGVKNFNELYNMVKEDEETENGKSVIFCFGRFNPPTAGHAMLFDEMKDYSDRNNCEYRIFTSSSNDTKSNPLDYNTKVDFIKKIHTEHAANVVNSSELSTFTKVASYLQSEGYVNAAFIGGSDREKFFNTVIAPYNGVTVGKKGPIKDSYSFESLTFVNAGNREDGADGVEGISGTLARQDAVDGNLQAFTEHTGAGEYSEDLFNAVRSGMKL
jgi:hypothetical protein